MGKPTSTGKPSWGSNAGGLLRGAARAMAVGRGKKLGLYKQQSAAGEQTGVPVGSAATGVAKSKGKAKPR